MTEEKDPLLLDHEADGIRELDNQLPRWWLWLFYLTIAFSGAYLSYYHVFHVGDLQADEYEREMRRAERQVAIYRATQAATTDPIAYEPTEDPAVLEVGKKLFGKHCAVCHGTAGQGLVGPNLTDQYWLHGGQYTDNIHVIQEGVVAKGMIPWKTVLRGKQIQAVASYIYTLRGSNPPDPKKAEGQQVIPPVVTPEPQDEAIIQE